MHPHPSFLQKTIMLTRCWSLWAWSHVCLKCMSSTAEGQTRVTEHCDREWCNNAFDDAEVRVGVKRACCHCTVQAADNPKLQSTHKCHRCQNGEVVGKVRSRRLRVRRHPERRPRLQPKSGGPRSLQVPAVCWDKLSERQPQRRPAARSAHFRRW